MAAGTRPTGRWLETLLSALFAFGVVAALVWGWLHRGERYLNAEYGLGYLLGIAGGSLMLILLLYPLRKRLPGLRIGSVKTWFRLHMAFGVLGPLLILFHANFSLGACNSNIALICMLIVASSGLIGRYLYAKIHRGLYGSLADLGELRRRAAGARDALDAALGPQPEVHARLLELDQALQRPGGLLGRWLGGWGVRLRLAPARRQLQRLIAAAPADRQGSLRAFVAEYLAAMRRAQEFSAYQRLFGLWHVLHLPLFFMMLLTAILHVVAVHMY